jgi:HSP20 family protein
MRDFPRLLLSSEVRDLGAEIARLFQDLDQALPGACMPALDVLESDTAFEIVMDLPGVAASGIRVLVKGGVVLAAGEKVPTDAKQRAEASFHLLERGFGRFARAVRLSGAFDAGHTRATLKGGELRIVIPKIPERRGQEILVPVEHQPA